MWIQKNAAQFFMLFLSKCLQPEPATEPPSALVLFLQKYANVSTKKPSVSSYLLHNRFKRVKSVFIVYCLMTVSHHFYGITRIIMELILWSLINALSVLRMVFVGQTNLK